MGFEDLKADLESHPIQGFDHYNNVIDLPLISHIMENLYVGGCVNGVDLGDTFGTVVSMYKWERYKGLHDLYEFTMYDSHEVDTDTLDKAVDAAVNSLEAGKATLVHCQAGINRSNLVAARVITKMYGVDHFYAVNLLREKRGQVVLSNPTFNQYLLSLDK